MFCGKETSTLSFMFLVSNAKLLTQRTGSSLRLRLFRNHEAKKLARGTTNEYEFSTFSGFHHSFTRQLRRWLLFRWLPGCFWFTSSSLENQTFNCNTVLKIRSNISFFYSRRVSYSLLSVNTTDNTWRINQFEKGTWKRRKFVFQIEHLIQLK